MFSRLICRLIGHKWKFAYNHGVEPGSKESIPSILAKMETGEYYKVHICSRCGIYDSPSDGLNPNTSIGSKE